MPFRLPILIRGQMSFPPCSSFYRLDFPSYPMRTVFFPGKKYHRSKFSDLCEASGLFYWPAIMSFRLPILIRNKPSFFLLQRILSVLILRLMPGELSFLLINLVVSANNGADEEHAWKACLLNLH